MRRSSGSSTRLVSLAAAALLASTGLIALPSAAAAADPLSIATIQGTAPFSPYQGKVVTTRLAVVTAIYPDGLNGFVIQTPGTGGPGRNLRRASDAIFVYTGTAPITVARGDLVSVTGKVTEYPASDDPAVESLTEIGGSVTVEEDTTTAFAPVRPITGITWTATAGHRENLESMLYATNESLLVADNYSLPRYGEIGLAAGGSLPVQPTDAAPFGSAKAKAQQRRNAASTVSLDDGSSATFFASKKYPAGAQVPYLTRDRDVKVGDRVRLDEPVIVDFRNKQWTWEPTHPITAGQEIATITNRPHESVPKVGGRFSVASFNVLNYFPTTGQGREGCTGSNLDTEGSFNITFDCDSRGAWDGADFDRQQTKIVTAINRLNASITGLMEIENSVKLGRPADEAVRTLVAALNRDAGYAKWAYVASSDQLQPVAEQDVITNALIFQPATVTQRGAAFADGADAHDDGPFGNARTPIAASFAPAGGGAPTLVVVNHFKSKGSGPTDHNDPNYDNGQGAYNADRIAQAKALLGWLPSVQQAAGARGVAMVGDYNSYTREDPLQTLADGGFRNAADPDDHSYNFSGLQGSLDHVLVNRVARRQLTGSGVWNINSIEPDALEYSEYKTTAIDYYRPDAYRASDHDPVIVGLAVPR